MSSTDRAVRLAETFQVPEWFDPEFTEAVVEVDGMQRMELYRVAGSLGVAERAGKMPEQVGDIFDFDSMRGESLTVLYMLARTKKAHLTGSVYSIDDLPRVSGFAAEILEELLDDEVAVDSSIYDRIRQKTESFDLILANMFGPDYRDEGLTEAFLPDAVTALRPSGLIVVNSDMRTMSDVYRWAEANLEPAQVTYVEGPSLPQDLQPTPHLLVTK